MADITKVELPAPPNLINAPDDYARAYQDSYSNVLRLYFNRLTFVLRALFDILGGSLLRFPYGAFHQDGSTVLTANMTNVSTAPIQVVSTVGFPIAGYLYIEREFIQYTGKTNTTFTGITRGAKATTNQAHIAGVSVTEAQGAPAATINLMLFTNTDFSNGVYLDNPVSGSKVYFTKAGLYNLQFSSQFVTFDSAEDDVTVWFRQDDVDVPLSAGIIGIPRPHGTEPGAVIVTWNIFLQIPAGGNVELIWTSLTGNTLLVTIPQGTAPVTPIAPSTILTATFVSAL